MSEKMVRVKYLGPSYQRVLPGYNIVLTRDEEVDLPEDVAKDMIEAGRAAPVSVKKKTTAKEEE